MERPFESSLLRTIGVLVSAALLMFVISSPRAHADQIPAGWEATEFSEVFEFLPANSFSREEMSYDIKANSSFNIHYGDIHATFTEQILDFKKHISQIPVLIHVPKNIGEDTFLKDGDLIIADASEDYAGVGDRPPPLPELLELAGRGDGLHST